MQKCKYNDAPFVPSNDCSSWESCTAEAYKQGKADGRKEAIDEVIKSYTTGFPTSLCTYCSQEACYGGMVGSIQECNFIKMLKDVLNDFGEELKE